MKFHRFEMKIKVSYNFMCFCVLRNKTKLFKIIVLNRLNSIQKFVFRTFKSLLMFNLQIMRIVLSYKSDILIHLKYYKSASDILNFNRCLLIFISSSTFY